MLSVDLSLAELRHILPRSEYLFLIRCIAGHTRELYEVQGITSTRTPRALSRGETNEAVNLLATLS